MNVLRNFKNQFRIHSSFFVAVPALVLQFCFCIFPLLFILATSFIEPSTWLLTLNFFKKVLTLVHFKMIAASLLLATGTASFCLTLGFPLAYWLARRAQKLKNFFVFLLIVPFWTNLLILIYSWLFILERHGLLERFLQAFGLLPGPLGILYSSTAVLIVTVYCYLPFMVLPIFNALEKIEKNILEASADLGATYTQTLRNIIIPLAWPGIKTGVFLVFVPVFGEFAIPLLVGGGKHMFVGNAIAHYVFTVFDLNAAAAFTVVSSFALLLSILFFLGIIKRIIYRT